MANLVEEHYLHSSKWTFFHNAQEAGTINPKTKKGNTYIDKIIKQLQEVGQTAKSREQAFYKDFNVTNNIEWANKYLIRGGASNERNIVLSIINSPQMIRILQSGEGNFETARKNLLNNIQNSGLAKDIIDYLINKANMADSMSDFFVKARILDFGAKGNIKITNKDVQQALFNSKTLGATFKAPQKILKSMNSKYIKEFEKSLAGGGASSKQRSALAITYLRAELEKRVPAVNKLHIEKYVNAFQQELQKNMKAKENRLVGNSNQMITGEVSEVGEVIAYLPFDDVPKDQNIRVEQAGRNTVQRAGNEVKSKIDTIWYGPISNKPYFIQNKNSNAEMYRQFQLTENIEDLTQNPTFIGIQSNISLHNLLERMSAYDVLTDEEKDSLIYLLVNYNVLNNFGDISKGYSKKEGAAPPAAQTQAAIDHLISNGLQYFLSDLLPQQDLHQVDGKFGDSQDFIIFMDRFLIPKSIIVMNLIAFLQDYQNQVMRLYTTSSLTGYTQSDFEDMYIEKIYARADDENPEQYDYHNEGLVHVGSFHGNKALTGLKINKISIKFKLENLISRSLI